MQISGLNIQIWIWFLKIKTFDVLIFYNLAVGLADFYTF